MSILDRINRFFAEPEPPRERLGGVSTREIGESGTEIFHGFIAQDYLGEFRHPSSTRIYDEMRKGDATVNAVLMALKLPILSTGFTIQSADAENESANEQAEFVRLNIEEYLEGGFKNFLRESLAYLDFGFYYFEKVFQFKDGKVCLRKLAPRLPSAHLKWYMDSDPNTLGVTQTLPNAKPGTPSNPEIPMSKLVLFTNNKEGDNYEGISILRSAYKSWYFKNLLYKIDGVHHERGAGILLIKLPKGSTAADKTDAENLGKNFKVNEQAYIVAPSSEWDISMLTSGISDQGGGRLESMKHHDRGITQNILAQFLDLGSGSTGSFALSKDQSNFFTLALRAITDYMAEVVNKQIVEELVRLNYGEQESYPSFAFQDVGEIDYEEMSTVLERLTNAGLVKNDPELKVWIHKTFGLPERTVEDFEDDDEDHTPPPPRPFIPEPEDVPMPEDEEMEGEMADRTYFRKLTFAEERMSLAEIDEFLDDQEAEVAEVLKSTTNEQKAQIMRDAEHILQSGAVATIAGLTVKGIGRAESALSGIAKTALERGKSTAAKEVATSIPASTNAAKQALGLRVGLIMAKRKSDIETAVKSRLLDLVTAGVGVKPALLDIEQVLDKALDKSNQSVKGAVVVDALGEGRAAVFEKARADIHGLQRSEVLDQKTCNMCMTLDGRVMNANDPFTRIGAVHDNCRGLWAAILKSDADLPPIKALPKTLKNRFETTEGVPSRNGFEQLKQPIVRKGSRLERKIKDGDIEV